MSCLLTGARLRPFWAQQVLAAPMAVCADLVCFKMYFKISLPHLMIKLYSSEPSVKGTDDLMWPVYSS